jgi:hypothetical protein
MSSGLFSLSIRDRALRQSSRCGWLEMGTSFSQNYHDNHAMIFHLGPTLSVKYRLFAALREAISVDDIFTILCSYLPDQVLVRGTIRQVR